MKRKRADRGATLAGLLFRKKRAPKKLLTSVPKAWSRSLRGESHGKLLRWALHGLVLLVVFGVPYVRGRLRAHDTQDTYARAAACMYGAAAAALPSTGPISDPSGYYASMVLHRSQGWPARCQPALRELARDPAHILLPSVKAAEVDVQKAAEIVLAEIASLPQTMPEGAKVPLRPLWGLEMLRNAVTAYAVAAGIADAETKVSPITLAAAQPAAPTPTLLDIDAAQDATIKVWGGDAELQIAAFDRRGVSYMRLSETQMTRARLPRIGSLRSFVQHGGAEYLVWTTAADKCGGTHCAGNSMGLAPMPVPLTRVPDPRWVAAHPFGSPERSVAWQGKRMWLAAAKLDGTARLVEFDIPSEPAAPAPKEGAPPLEPVATKLDGARDLVVFTDSAGVLGALVVEVDEGEWSLAQLRNGSPKRQLVQLPQGWNSAWVRTCLAPSEIGDSTRYFVLGSATQVLVGSVRGEAVTTWRAFDAAIPPPRREDRDPAVSVACTEGGVTLAFMGADSVLRSATCTPDAAQCVAQTLSELATGVDVAYTSDSVLVAYSGAPDQPQVRLRRLTVRGALDAATTVPGPCWERWGGMCGEPTLAWAGKRLVLAARSGASLMGLESADEGKTWSELRSTGLVKPPDPHVLPRLAVR